MKKQLINIFAILICVLTLAAVSKANSANRLEFVTAFDFNVKNQTLPAGKYTIERLNFNDPNTLILRNANSEIKAIFRVQQIISREPKAENQVNFKRLNDNYYLTEIWESGATLGYRILWDETK